MPKFFSQNALESLNQTSGQQPIVIVGINWGTGISYYSTKTLTVDAYNIKGCIKSIGSISNQKQSDSMGNCSEVTITMDDWDNEFKFIADNTLIEKKPIAIFQHFIGNSTADYIPLFYGRISGPVSWSEGDRSLTFSATSELETTEIGISPTQEDFNDISPEAEGVPWPLIFGKVKHVPCVQIRRHSEAILSSTIRLRSKVSKIVKNTGVTKKEVPQTIKLASDCDTLSINTDEENIMYFESGDNINFAVDEDIDISVDNVIFRGRYDPESNSFKIKQSNKPMFVDVKLGARDANDVDEKARSPGFKSKDRSPDPLSGYNVLWLADDKINLNQKHCYFRFSDVNKDWYGFCEAQYGRKCIFRRPFRHPTTGQPFLMTQSNVIEEVYAVERNGLEAGLGDELATLVDQHDTLMYQSLFDRINMADGGFWSRPSGTKVRVWNQDDPDIYILSGVELSSVEGIYGKRKVPLENGKEIEVFAPIPSYYFEIQLQSNFQVQGDYASAIIFHIPLEERDDKKWENQVYVSCTSTVGPNTADILKYLILRFTDYGINSSSFSTTALKIDDVPSNFALMERGDTLRFCQEIAWQARCAVLVVDQVIKLKYLGEAGTQVMLLNEDNILFRSPKFEFTDSIDVVTKLIGSWTPSYQDTERPTRHHERRTAHLNEIIRALTEESRSTRNATRISIFKNNIDKYGVIPREERIYIYNDEDSVFRCLDFWGYRFSNIWRKIRVKGAMPTLLLEEFDTVAIDLTIPNLATLILAVVESVSYDPIELETEIVLWLPSVAGTQSLSPVAYA